MKDPRVLEKAANDRAHANIVAAAGDARPETAEPPNHQVNRDPGTGRFTQRLDDLGVFELVHLGYDAGRAPSLLVVDLPLDQFEKPWAHGRWRHQDSLALGGLRMTCQVVEQVDDVACERWITRQEPDVGIESGRAHVVISGPNVRVTAQPGWLLAHDQRLLGMCLQTAHPKDNMGASPGQLSGPVQIAFLVEYGHK